MDLFKLVKNYLAKEKLMMESMRLGIDYRVLSETTFKFLLELKQEIDPSTLPWMHVQAQASNG